MTGSTSAVWLLTDSTTELAPDLHSVVTKGKYFFVGEKIWSYRSATMFLLFRRFLFGEDILPQIRWLQSIGANSVRVLGMVAWSGREFGPSTPGYWDALSWFVFLLAEHGLRVEFTVFADAQIIIPGQHEQRLHLQRVVQQIGWSWNLLIEIANEPFKNGVEPTKIFGPSDPRGCPMAYGDYLFQTSQSPDGVWHATMSVLDYVTMHTSRDDDAWSRKAKDVLEMRDGSGDGSEERYALWPGSDTAVSDDEPMGAAEVPSPGRRSNVPDDFFWHHAVAHLYGAGSTFHSESGLQGLAPAVGTKEQACADAVTQAWTLVGPEWQQGRYTRGGLDDLPLVWDESYFPDQTSRLYGSILGNQCLCVAVKPNDGWVAEAVPGWKIVSTGGPRDTVVLCERS